MACKKRRLGSPLSVERWCDLLADEEFNLQLNLCFGSKLSFSWTLRWLPGSYVSGLPVSFMAEEDTWLEHKIPPLTDSQMLLLLCPSGVQVKVCEYTYLFKKTNLNNYFTPHLSMAKGRKQHHPPSFSDMPALKTKHSPSHVAITSIVCRCLAFGRWARGSPWVSLAQKRSADGLGFHCMFLRRHGEEMWDSVAGRHSSWGLLWAWNALLYN